MNYKNIRNLALVGFSLMLLFSCGSSNGVETRQASNVQISKASYQKWVAGIAGGGAGYTISVEVDEKSMSSNIQMDSVFFRNWKAPLKNKQGNLFSATIFDGTNSTPNGSLSTDNSLVKESDRIIWETVSFTLNDDEAMIAYTENGTRNYLKVKLANNTSQTLPR